MTKSNLASERKKINPIYKATDSEAGFFFSLGDEQNS